MIRRASSGGRKPRSRAVPAPPKDGDERCDPTSSRVFFFLLLPPCSCSGSASSSFFFFLLLLPSSSSFFFLLLPFLLLPSSSSFFFLLLPFLLLPSSSSSSSSSSCLSAPFLVCLHLCFCGVGIIASFFFLVPGHLFRVCQCPYERFTRAPVAYGGRSEQEEEGEDALGPSEEPTCIIPRSASAASAQPSPRRSPRLAAAEQLKAEVAALPMRRLSLGNSGATGAPPFASHRLKAFHRGNAVSHALFHSWFQQSS
eukprot:COSAG05_NODE_276_length_12393_cov_1737.505694_7_plen_255_part_00